MQKQTGYAASVRRRFSIKTVARISAVLLLVLLAIAGYFLFKGYREGQEIRQYVGGPFGAQLLYLQSCAVADTGGDGQPATLEAQLRSCQRSAGRPAGYFVYDFNIRRSIALNRKDLALWKEYSVLSFPESIRGQVVNSETNPFNNIVPFGDFTGFDYDCVPAGGEGGASCKRASASCELSADTIRCTVSNPRTKRGELHVIERYAGLDLLLPQGFITGPDLYKMLKPRFFPVLDRW